MRKPNIVLPTLVLCVIGMFSASAVAQDADSQAKPDSASHIRKIYAADCAICHGATGTGKTDLAADMKLTLDDWTDPRSLIGKSDQLLIDIVRKGKDKMPPESEDRASNEDVRRLVAYIRSLSKAQPPSNVAENPAAKNK